MSCWPAGLWNCVDCILVDFWPKMGTISTSFFADMLYKQPYPCSEKAPVDTDLLYAQPHNTT